MPAPKTLNRRLFLGRSAGLFGGAVLLGGTPLLAACGGDDADGTGDASDGTSPPTDPPGSTAAPTSAPAALTTVRQKFNWIEDIEWSAWYLADHNGWFAENGVEVGFLYSGEGAPAAAQVLAAGDAELAISADELEIIRANQAGEDFIMLGAMYQRSPSGLCWLAETDIQSAADLVGKRIGGHQGDQVRIETAFKVNGLDIDYEFIPMSFDPQPLVDGEMDVITCYVTNQPIQLELRGIPTGSASYSDFGVKSHGDVIFGPRAWIEENRDAAVRYLAALIRGVDANVADPAAVIPVLLENYANDTELDEAYLEPGNRAYISLIDSPFTESNGRISVDPEFLATEVWSSYETAGETDLPAVEDFFDPSIVADAHALLG